MRTVEARYIRVGDKVFFTQHQAEEVVRITHHDEEDIFIMFHTEKNSWRVGFDDIQIIANQY